MNNGLSSLSGKIQNTALRNVSGSGRSSLPSTPIKNQTAAQGSLPLILRHYKWDSANTNTVPIKVVRTGYQAFENSIMRTLFSTVKDVDYITSE